MRNLRHRTTRLETAHLFLTAILFIGLAACGATTPAPSLPDNKSTITIVGQVIGRFTTIDGHDVDLATNSGHARILMFDSETCAVCRRETTGLVQDRKTRGIAKNVDFYTVLVGAELQDAVDFQKELSTDWLIGIDPGDNLFRTHCPEGQTPCMFLTNVSGTTVKMIGPHSIAEWEQITGPWQF